MDTDFYSITDCLKRVGCSKFMSLVEGSSNRNLMPALSRDEDEN